MPIPQPHSDMQCGNSTYILTGNHSKNSRAKIYISSRRTHVTGFAGWPRRSFDPRRNANVNPGATTVDILPLNPSKPMPTTLDGGENRFVKPGTFELKAQDSLPYLGACRAFGLDRLFWARKKTVMIPQISTRLELTVNTGSASKRFRSGSLALGDSIFSKRFQVHGN